MKKRVEERQGGARPAVRGRGRRGAALFTVMVIVVTLTAFLGTASAMALQRVFLARKLTERVKAVAIAEAGAHYAYSVLATNFNLRGTPSAFPATAYGDGVYSLDVRPVGDHMASIWSTGVCGTVTEVVVLDVKRTPGSSGGIRPPAFDYAIVAGGVIDWTGASAFYGGGGAHANGQFTRSGAGNLEANVSSSTGFHSNGNAGGIAGDVAAPELSGNLSKITGSKTTAPVPLVEIPDIDLTPYYNAALAKGEVRSGNVTLSGSYTPNGGILWVNGTLSLAGNCTFTGCFIATGNLSVSGGGAVAKVAEYPTLVSRDGNISFTGTKAVGGLIYVKTGDYTQAGGNNLTGQIVVRGNISKSGVSTVINYSDSTPTPPGGGESTEDIVSVSAWQR